VKNSEAQLFEDEWYIVRYSGEIPEIALNSALYFLTQSKDGPQLTLDERQIEILKRAALDRFSEIVTRDLLHNNHKKSMYRGIKRSIYNYQRLCGFCSRQLMDITDIREEAGRLLPLFLETEADLVASGDHSSIINCTYNDLQQFAAELRVRLQRQLRERVKPLCRG